MDLMAAKHTWSKMDWPGVNLILKGTMGPPVSHEYCDTWICGREPPTIDSGETSVQDHAMNKLARKVAGMLLLFGSSACLAQTEELVAVVDLKFLKDDRAGRRNNVLG